MTVAAALQPDRARRAARPSSPFVIGSERSTRSNHLADPATGPHTRDDILTGMRAPTRKVAVTIVIALPLLAHAGGSNYGVAPGANRAALDLRSHERASCGRCGHTRRTRALTPRRDCLKRWKTRCLPPCSACNHYKAGRKFFDASRSRRLVRRSFARLRENLRLVRVEVTAFPSRFAVPAPYFCDGAERGGWHGLRTT